MRWWCSGEAAVPWTWTPQPYVGIWLVMLGLAAGYVLAMRRYARQPAGHPPTRTQMLAFGAAWVLLWGATDWPLGTLSAGYLLTASMVQILLYYYIAAPLLVLGTPRGLREQVLTSPRLRPLAVAVRRPMIAFTIINVALVVTHIPAIADFLKATELGTMAMDLVWLTTGIVFWWSLDASRPDDSSVRFLKKGAYVLGSKAVPTLLGILLTFHNFPLYTTYEFANRVWPGFSALEDQQTAGLLMWMGMMPVLVLRLGLVFRDAYLADRAQVEEGAAGMAALRAEGERRG